MLVLFAPVGVLLPLQTVFVCRRDACWVNCRQKQAADKETEDGLVAGSEDRMAAVGGNEDHWSELGIVDAEAGKVDHEGVIRAEEKAECGQQD